MIGKRCALVVNDRVFGGGKHFTLDQFGPAFQLAENRPGGRFIPAAGRHVPHDPRAVPVLGHVGAGLYGNPIPGGGKRRRPRLALGVFPLGKPLPLADDDPCPGRQRLGKGFLVDGSHDSPFVMSGVEPVSCLSSLERTRDSWPLQSRPPLCACRPFPGKPRYGPCTPRHLLGRGGWLR